MMLFDEERQQIRGWWFNNKGVFPRSETIGQWVAKTETLHLRSEFDGNNQIVKLVFTNKDRIDWTMVIKNNDGDLMMDAVGHTARKKPTAAAAKRSPEHQVLDRFVGTWDVDLSITISGQEVAKEEAVETRSWSQGGKVVHFENAEGTEFHMLLGYDPETRTYPGVILAGAFRTLMTGTWDPKKTTMSFTGNFPDGNKFKGTHRFVDENHAEAASSTTNPAGKVLISQTWKQTRRQK